MNIGVIGTGSIAKTMIAEFQSASSLRCAAVCSRSAAKGQAIADEFGIEKVYTSYDAMLADEDIQLIYIATPNGLHYAQTKAALLAGRHVLCEKPFVPTAAEAEELAAIAKAKRLFLFEAITTAHHPNYALARGYLPRIGAVKAVACTFCQYSSRYQALLDGQNPPVFDPKMYGGALMDINLYNIHFVVGLFGAPKAVHYFANTYTNGIDTSGVLVLEYPDFVCQCTGAKDCAAQNSAQIIGSEGEVIVTPGSNTCQSVTLAMRGQQPVTSAVEANPWHYEVLDIERLLAAGALEECYSALQTSCQVAAVLEQARRSAGLCF